LKQAESTEAAFEAAIAQAAGEPAQAEAPETAEETEEGDPSEEVSEDTPEEDDQDDAEATPSDPVAAAKALFDAGDVEGLAKLLGTTAPALDAKAFVRMRKAESLVRQAEQDRAQQAQLLAEARRMYGPLAKARVAAKKGDATALRQLIEETTQKRLEEVLPLLQKSKPVDPDVAALRAELAELRKATGRASRHSDLAKHAVAKLPDWEDEIDAMVEASYDADLGDYKLTPREAADQLVAKTQKRAQALGIARTGGKPGPKPGTPRQLQTKGGGGGAPSKGASDEERRYQAAMLAASVTRKQGGGRK
jgi:hypothetical protein